MLCPSCNSPNTELSKFCSECGSNLGSDPSVLGISPRSASPGAIAGSDSPPARQPDASSSAPRTVGGDTLPSPLPPPGASLRDTMLGNLPSGVVFANRYEILEVIGRGGMGTVYKAHDKNLDEVVALKLIRPDLVPLGSILDRFKHETRLARRLAHPNIIKVYDLNDSDGLVYLSMEYLEGVDLRTRIIQDGPLPIEESIDIACQLASGLSYAHANGVVHRDIKPHNVFLTHDGRVKILDFGLAKAVDSTQLSSTGQMLGTPLYMAPEQASPEKGEPPDHRADIYSLGVVLYQIFTGMPPFQGTTPVEVALLHLRQDPQPLREIRPEIPPFVETVVLTLLSKARGERPADAAEIIPALHGGAPLKPSGTVAVPLGPRERRGGGVGLEATFAPDGMPERGGAPARKPAPERRVIPRGVWAALVTIVLVLSAVGVYLKFPRLSADERVEQLFFLADGYFEKGQLVEPKGRNALEPYREILKLQPLNRKAIDRIQSIFEKLVEQTGAALDRAATASDSQAAAPSLTEASKWFADARALNPEDPAISDLSKRVDKITMAFAERETLRTRLASDLDQADQWMKENQLVRPAGANALEAYRRVLAEDPTSRRARDGVAKVSEVLKRSALEVEKSDPFLARERYQQAREAAPEDTAIVTALATLDKEIEHREARARATATAQHVLDQAREHLAAGKLVRPRGDSALDRYRQVLAMAPGNEEAEKGLAEIARRLVAAARDDAGAGRLEIARQSLSDALEAKPGDPAAQAEIAKVEGEIARIAEDDRRRQRIASALARADGLRKLGQLVEPDDSNALDAYRQVLDLDPENAAAKDALVGIREQLAEAARGERKAGRLEEARLAFVRALKAAPADAALAGELEAVARDIDKERAEAAASASAVQTLLTQAEGYLLRNQLTLPPDRNALDTYRKVLAKETTNAKALAGLHEVATRLVALGDEQLGRGNAKAALSYYQKALSSESGENPALAAKVKDTQTRIAAEMEAAAASAAAAPQATGTTTGTAGLSAHQGANVRLGEALDHGLLVEALSWLEEARALDPRDATTAQLAARLRDLAVAKGDAAANQGEWEEAQRMLRIAQRAVPGDAGIDAKLAKAEQAATTAQSAPAANPPSETPAPSDAANPRNKRALPPQYIPTF